MPSQVFAPPYQDLKSFKYRPDKFVMDVGMSLSSHPDRDHEEKVDWISNIAIACSDVPALMREGLFWTSHNIVPEEGFMNKVADFHYNRQGLFHRRTWYLTEKDATRQFPLWVAEIEVLAPDVKTLATFRPHSMLSHRHVQHATAWADPHGNQHMITYRFKRNKPDQCYNCIYDDTPLKGWWPWPRVPEEAEAVDMLTPASSTMEEPSPVSEGI